MTVEFYIGQPLYIFNCKVTLIEYENPGKIRTAIVDISQSPILLNLFPDKGNKTVRVPAALLSMQPYDANVIPPETRFIKDTKVLYINFGEEAEGIYSTANCFSAAIKHDFQLMQVLEPAE